MLTKVHTFHIDHCLYITLWAHSVREENDKFEFDPSTTGTAL